MKNYKSYQACIVCGQNGENMTTYHHIRTRKSGGTDETYNLMPLCLRCHNEVHKIGIVSFSKKHPSVHNWLIKNSWQFSMGKWFYSSPEIIDL